MENQDTEYTLTVGEHCAVVSPFGASLRRYFITNEAGEEWNAVWGYSGGAGKRGGQGDVLIPFPGRIKNAHYAFEGKTFELAKTDKDGPNAIHGFLRATVFKTKHASSTEVVFTNELNSGETKTQGYPFPLSIEIAYTLTSKGLTTRFKIKNVGTVDAPVGAGFHPYFRAAEGELADWKITIPAKTYVELENVVPTGRLLPVDGTPNDFRNGRVIGDAKYNDCVAGLSRDHHGWATATVESAQSSRRVSIRMDAGFDYIVIYTGDQIAAPDQRKGFAIEPMTCAPDAFNRDGWGTRVLKPGESLSGSYVISAN